MSWKLLYCWIVLAQIPKQSAILYPHVPKLKETAPYSRIISNSSSSQEAQLLFQLLENYESSVRPVRKASTVVEVKVGLTLTHIYKIDEKNQVVTLNMWIEQEWLEERFSWNPMDYGNMTRLTMPTRFVWTPDILLLNNAQDYYDLVQTNVAVFSDGVILWAPPVRLQSICRLDVTYFPFDDQICYLRFGSWIYDINQLIVTNRSESITRDSFIDNGEWRILETGVRLGINHRGTSNGHTLSHIEYFMRLRRRVLYYVYNIIIPCLMLSALTLVQFWLPCASGEKITLGLTVLLTYSVFSFNIGESMPETSDVIPLIAIYIICIMAISSLSVILSVIVLNIHYAGGFRHNVPHWLQYLAYSILAPVIYRKMRKYGKDVSVTDCITRRLIHSAENSMFQLRQLDTAFANSNIDVDVGKKITLSQLDASELNESIYRKLKKPRRNENFEKALSKLLIRSRLLVKEAEAELIDYEWQRVAIIFDKLFFLIVLILSVSAALWTLIILPLSYRHGFSY